MAIVHLKACRCYHKQLEWSWRGQHCRKHKRPELVPIEGMFNLFEAGGGHPFAKKRLTPGITAKVEQAAAHCRTSSSEDCVKPEACVVLIHIAGHHRIQGQTQQRSIHGGNDEHSPNSQRSK